VLKFALHGAPFVCFLFGYWLTGVTLMALVFLFYVKTFKLESYKKDLEDRGNPQAELVKEIVRSIERWKRFTFINEYRDQHDQAEE